MRNAITPPYSQRDIPAILVTLVVLLIVPFTIVFLSNRNILSSNAAEKFTCSQSPQENRGITKKEEKQANVAKLKQLNQDFVSAVQNFSNDRSQGKKAQVQALAQQRKETLITAMRQSPEDALTIVMNDKNYPIIQETTQNCSPHEVTVAGTTKVDHVDDFDSGNDNTFISLQTEAQGEVMLHPARSQVDIISSMNIQVKGYQLDNDVLINGENPENIQVLSQPQAQNIIQKIFGLIVKKAEAISMGPIGDQPTVVLLVNYRNKPLSSSITRDFVTDMVFNRASGVYQESSFNKTRLIGGSGAVFGPFTMNYDAPSTCPYTTIISEAIKAADATVDFRNYARLIVVKPDDGCGGNSWGSVGQQSLSTSDGKVAMSWALLRSYTDTRLSFVTLHEVGHGLGLYHSSFASCGSTTFCSAATEYEDRYDFMSRYLAGGGHPNAANKQKLGWWNSTSNLLTVTSNGTFTLEPYETNTAGLKAIRIPRKSGGNLYIEYRTRTGVDTALDSGSNAGSDVYNGALLHTDIRYSGIDTELLDPNPPTNALDTTLEPGQSMTDSTNGITISTISKTDAGLTVQVQFSGGGSTPTPTNIQPSPTPTAIPTVTPVPGSPTPIPTVGPIDTIKPTISITNPLNGSIVARRSTVTISANATDDMGIDHVTFSVGGNVSTDYAAPYSYSWSVGGKPNSRYTITATAFDAANNSSSQTITVTSGK